MQTVVVLPVMTAVDQIESSIEDLPAQDFFELIGWMAQKHLERLSSNAFESQELEAALLKCVDQPRLSLNDKLLAEIRASAGSV
jgi:hypothetical protein